MKTVAVQQKAIVPVLVGADGQASLHFLEFFATNIRNPNTRRAYLIGATEFLNWCTEQGLNVLPAIQPSHVATWVEGLCQTHSISTVRQRLAAVRRLFDWMVQGQIMPSNPAYKICAPKHSVQHSQTPVLAPEEMRHLMDSIPTDTIGGLRDRALISLMTYTFARIGAALDMEVRDVYAQHGRLWVRLHEKGGKRHELPCHHKLAEYLEAYVEAGNLRNDPRAPLFATIGRGTVQLTRTPLAQANAFQMIRRRAKAAGINSKVGCHTFRATGISSYLNNGGALEKAAQMANHVSTSTTQRYLDRSGGIDFIDVERISI